MPPAQTQIPIPPALLNALIGARFDAQLINVTPQGLLTPQGSFGQVQLQLLSPLSLTPGDALVLQLTNKGNGLQFVIVTVNGQNATALRAGGAQILEGARQAAGSATALPFTQGGLLTATLLRPTIGFPALAQPSARTPTQPSGPTVTGTAGLPGVQTIQGQAPALPGGQAAGGAPGVGQPAVAESVPGGAPALPGQAASGQPGAAPVTLPPGTQFTFRIADIQPPPPGGASSVTPLTGQAVLAQGQTLTGIVTGQNAGGQPIVETVLGPIAINGANPPPEGARVVLTVTTTPLPPTAAEPLLDNQQLFLRQALFLDRQWPALNETLQALEQAAPNAALQITQTALPRPDANLAANIMFFLAALRGGDLRSWLGDQPMRVLQRVNPGLLNRLRDDMGRISSVAEDPGSGDWRTVMVPFHNGQSLDQVRLLIRNQDTDEDDEEDNTGTRFVVDVSLSRLGHIQLDGLVNTNRRRLDMVVRSDPRLPPDMQNDIRRLYDGAREITGFRGGVGFQAQPANFIDIRPPAEKSGNGGVGLVV
ncbi:MAG: hypothetical protein VW268_15295 [Rhodospirillaceae bacterium]